MPSMAQIEPLGLTSTSMPGTPLTSTYCVMIWPLSASLRTSSSLHRKRPSPWEMGTVYTSPTCVPANHGERLEAMRVRTRRDWWRPIVLKVSVGQDASVSMISP